MSGRGRSAGEDRGSGARDDDRARPRGIGVEAAILAGAFAGATLLAELLGAANLGTALTFGTIAFLAAVLALMLLPRGD